MTPTTRRATSRSDRGRTPRRSKEAVPRAGVSLKLETILVPLDGSSLAESAVWPAADLAKQVGARLLLLRVAEPSTLPGDLTEKPVRLVGEATAYLSSIGRTLFLSGVKGIDTTVRTGRPAASIAEVARSAAVDLIVMTTHGRSGLGRMLLGSVAQSVLRGTRTPVLLLRGPGRPDPQARA